MIDEWPWDRSSSFVDMTSVSRRLHSFEQYQTRLQALQQVSALSDSLSFEAQLQHASNPNYMYRIQTEECWWRRYCIHTSSDSLKMRPGCGVSLVSCHSLTRISGLASRADEIFSLILVCCSGSSWRLRLRKKSILQLNEWSEMLEWRVKSEEWKFMHCWLSLSPTVWYWL